MSVTYACDGCSQFVEEPIKLGMVIRRDYCEKCAVPVRKYLEEQDELHDRLSSEWTLGMAELRKKWSEKAKVLPDE